MTAQLGNQNFAFRLSEISSFNLSCCLHNIWKQAKGLQGNKFVDKVVFYINCPYQFEDYFINRDIEIRHSCEQKIFVHLITILVKILYIK